MVTAYCIAYGWEWLPPTQAFLDHLVVLHEEYETHCPLDFVKDAWEEMWWRHCTGLREAAHRVLHQVGPELVASEEFLQAARAMPSTRRS